MFGLLFFCGVRPAAAQFNPASQAVRVESILKKDTIPAVQAPLQPANMSFTLYSDAYDNYLRKQRSKQRNRIKISAGLFVTQTTFENWFAGGDNSFSGRANLNIEHQYTAPVFSIRSVFDAKYGALTTSDLLRKTDDYFYISSTPSWNISARWKLSSTVIWKSQFSQSFDYKKNPAGSSQVYSATLKSSFMAPSTVEISGGFTYESKNKKLNLLLSPIAGKFIMVLNDQLAQKGGFGIDPKTENPYFKPQVGSMVRVDYATPFANKKMAYKTRYESFFNYKYTPTVWWENKLDFKFTNVLSANFYVLAIFNDQVDTPKAKEDAAQGLPVNRWHYLQVNQSLGFGLTYNFASKQHKPIQESTITKSRLKSLK